jgi:hypothetical protein
VPKTSILKCYTSVMTRQSDLSGISFRGQQKLATILEQKDRIRTGRIDDKLAPSKIRTSTEQGVLPESESGRRVWRRPLSIERRWLMDDFTYRSDRGIIAISGAKSPQPVRRIIAIKSLYWLTLLRAIPAFASRNCRNG